MRRGFTIIEMLVVIGILALLMGLTIGGIAAMRKTDKLLATEYLVAGSIRQARHTARTSGSPVILQISKGERRISAVTRISLAQEGFDNAVSTRLIPLRPISHLQGISGLGAEVETPAVGDTAPEFELKLPDKLIRRAGRNEGFYLSCAVRPPQIGGGGVPHYPLVVVGNGDEVSTAIGGIYLRSSFRIEQNVQQAGQASKQATAVTWEIVGWVHNSSDATDAYEISSLEESHCPPDIVRDEPLLHASSSDYDVAWPMAGGVWEEIGLLFDGDKGMVLYRNGVRVGERTLPNSTTLPHYTPTEKMVVGRQQWMDQGVLKTSLATGSAFDDIAIFRLAAVDAGTLPADVEPAGDWRIIAHPDGRVDLFPGGPLLFQGRFGGAATAEVTVTAYGKVSSKIVIPP